MAYLKTYEMNPPESVHRIGSYVFYRSRDGIYQ